METVSLENGFSIEEALHVNEPIYPKKSKKLSTFGHFARNFKTLASKSATTSAAFLFTAWSAPATSLTFSENG